MLVVGDDDNRSRRSLQFWRDHACAQEQDKIYRSMETCMSTGNKQIKLVHQYISSKLIVPAQTYVYILAYICWYASKGGGSHWNFFFFLVLASPIWYISVKKLAPPIFLPLDYFRWTVLIFLTTVKLVSFYIVRSWLLALPVTSVSLH